MKFVTSGHDYVVRFDKGEEIVSGLKSFVLNQNIRGGWVTGLGGLTHAELGFYNLKSKEYDWKKLNIGLELTSLSGNISWQDDQPFLHLHANVSDAALRAYGGHLKTAEVAGTVEVYVHVLDGQELNRTRDEETGLNLLDL